MSQKTFFDSDWGKEWVDMPEFVQEAEEFYILFLYFAAIQQCSHLYFTYYGDSFEIECVLQGQALQVKYSRFYG